MTRCRAFVSGRVQGVFFRQSTAERAREAGVAGWVRNLPDGRVEMLLEGSPEAIEAVLSWARDGGPPAARVDDVRVEELPADTQPRKGFEVL